MAEQDNNPNMGNDTQQDSGRGDVNTQVTQEAPKSGSGALIGIVIIIIVLVLGGFYFLGTGSDTDEETTEEDLEALEEDLENTDLDELDNELNDLDTAIEEEESTQ